MGDVYYALEENGLSVDLLEKLSYHSDLGISLKRNVHYFDKERLQNKKYGFY